MFRLLKLALYAVIGYALYELFQGLTTEPGSRGGGRRASSDNLNRALNESGGRMETLTGRGGTGIREQTLDADGASLPHQVGRGVRAV